MRPALPAPSATTPSAKSTLAHGAGDLVGLPGGQLAVDDIVVDDIIQSQLVGAVQVVVAVLAHAEAVGQDQGVSGTADGLGLGVGSVLMSWLRASSTPC